MDQKNHLLEKPILELLKEIALPATIGIIFNTLYNITDTYFAGRISTQAVAALSVSFFVYFLLMSIGFGFSGAITALCGNALGNNKKNLAKIYAHKGLFLMSVILGLLALSLGIIASEPILKYLSRGAQYKTLAQEYLNIMFISSPFLFGSFALNAILVSVGDTKSYRNMLVVGFFLNILLNSLYMYGFWLIPALGFQGIAFSTLNIQIISVCYLFYKTYKAKMLHFKNITFYLPEMRIYKNLFTQALPSSLSTLSGSISSIILLYFVAYYGEKVVAGYGIAYRIEQMALLPLFGISSAILTIVANNYGAKQIDRVQEVFFKGLKIGFFICFAGAIVGLCFGKYIVGFFDNNQEVIKSGYGYLKVAVCISFGYGIHFFSNSFLQGIKKPKIIFFVSLYRQLIILLPLFYLFTFVLEFDKEYLWYSIFFAVYSAALYIFFHIRKVLKTLNKEG